MSHERQAPACPAAAGLEQSCWGLHLVTFQYDQLGTMRPARKRPSAVQMSNLLIMDSSSAPFKNGLQCFVQVQASLPDRIRVCMLVRPLCGSSSKSAIMQEAVASRVLLSDLQQPACVDLRNDSSSGTDFHSMLELEKIGLQLVVRQCLLSIACQIVPGGFISILAGSDCTARTHQQSWHGLVLTHLIQAASSSSL